jgi:iron complex outermembrane recepter protein
MSHLSSFPIKSHRLRYAIAAALASSATFVTYAQNSPQRIEPIIVTGNPFERAVAGQPWSVLLGDDLAQRQSGTLGETLNGMPGVSSTYFGPNSSRPIIRGLDSERIRVMENGASSVDAASLSFDHAVPIDPIAIERIEVLRGPAALLYGGAAVGGVVNAISNRIPKASFKQPAFTLQSQFGGAERAAMGAIRGNATFGDISVHVDASRRETEDLRVPTFTLPDGDTANRVVNSALEATSGAVGISRTTANGYLGVSFDSYRSTYGIVVEPDVTIDMKRERVMLAGEQRVAGSLFNTWSGHFAHTRYQHQEIEGTGEVGTTFKNRGHEWRVEGKTAQYGAWRSVIGMSGDNSRFSAVGEEAFVPPTQSNNAALFAKQEGKFGNALVAFGGRVERNRVSASEVLDESGEVRFGPADSKRLNLVSGSFGLTQKLSKALSLHGNLSYSERAPSYFERYADGVHLATAAYERGDRSLPKEKSTHLDVGFAYKDGPFAAQLTAFTSRHKNFVSLDFTGEFFEADEHEEDAEKARRKHGDEEAVFPIYQFRAVPARFSGLELESSLRVIDSPSSTLDFGLGIDMVRASNRATNEALPRIAPTRISFNATYRTGPWQLRGEVVHAAKQSRVPAVEREENAASDGTTAAYTLLNLTAAYDIRVRRLNGNVFIKGTNLTNELGYNAASIRSVRELSPLPGRGVRAGVTLNF